MLCLLGVYVFCSESLSLRHYIEKAPVAEKHGGFFVVRFLIFAACQRS
jgi:hypothetical protein